MNYKQIKKYSQKLVELVELYAEQKAELKVLSRISQDDFSNMIELWTLKGLMKDTENSIKFVTKNLDTFANDR